MATLASADIFGVCSQFSVRGRHARITEQRLGTNAEHNKSFLSSLGLRGTGTVYVDLGRRHPLDVGRHILHRSIEANENGCLHLTHDF